MYVVTFYSFKGGVGRTMALVNTSVALARLGRRVLVVDFDLEAPGIPSYSVFQKAMDCKGVVDYVTEYRSMGIAPDARDYISPCDIENNRIWVMPAGCHTRPGYNEALNSIDWQDLYEHRDGYLMFEDLKQQWKQFDGEGFDYVLIDSRTGHTDVGGICTRQLPDAVMVMFLPNDQNIDGLAPIISGIRAENKDRNPKIAIEFCPSNVPDLDDENDILSSQLKRAKKTLKFESESSIINHYSSYDVLAQKAFVLARPNSKLSKQYEKLRSSIVALNYDDPEGARVALKRLPAEYERARRESHTKAWGEVRNKTADIRSRHPTDGEIAFLASRILSEIGDSAGEIEALNAAIDLNYERNRAYLARAFTYSSIGKQEEAKADLRAVVASPDVSIFELGPALQILQEIDRDWTEILGQVLRRADLDLSTINALSTYALSHREALRAVAEVSLERVNSGELENEALQVMRNNAVLALIASRQFTRAIEYLERTSGESWGDFHLIDLFNYAMAKWGLEGAPSLELFTHCLEKFAFAPERTSNALQCLALAAGVVGDKDHAVNAISAALERLQPGVIAFSCWTYLYSDADEFRSDLGAMKVQIERNEPIKPLLFEVG